VLEDRRTADVEPRLAQTLALLEKVTLTPDEVEPADVEAVRHAGVSDQEISDALHVCFCFNLIDRLADSFGWHIQTREEFDKDATFLLKKGYDLIGPVRKRALASR
jgi:alkylhydroperoxidase family enzyme